MAKDKLKGLILSGGKGSRLRPFTYTGAKQLVPIANKPVLFYAIEDLVGCGIRDIGIVVGDTREQVMAAVGDGSRWGVSVTYIQQDAPLGIAHAVKVAADFLARRPFVLYLGDNLVLGGIASFAECFRSEPSNCQLLLHRVANPQSFGVAEMVDGHVARVVEKPSRPPSDLAVIGVYMFDERVFPVVEQLRPSARGELEIADAIQHLIDAGLAVQAQVLERYWMDTGKMDDILEANAVVLDALPAANEGSIDGASRVEGKVILEAGAADHRPRGAGGELGGRPPHVHRPPLPGEGQPHRRERGYGEHRHRGRGPAHRGEPHRALRGAARRWHRLERGPPVSYAGRPQLGERLC